MEGDLHMDAVGCYSVVAWLKRENIRAETELVTAEKLASISELLTGRRLEVRDTLRAAWEQVLFGQFHDGLGGSCTEEVCEDLRLLYGQARAVADDVATRPAQLLARHADTWVNGTEGAERNQSANPFVSHFPVPVVVSNPLSEPVRVPLAFPHEASAVATADGPLPVQSVASREGTRYATHALTVGDLPAIGFRVFWLSKVPSSAAPREQAGVAGDGLSVGNGSVDLQIDPTAGLVGVRAGGSGGYSDHGAEWVTDDPIDQPATDQGSHEISYRLRFDATRSPATAAGGPPRRAVAQVTETWHRGPLGAQASALSVRPAHASVEAFKRSEAGDGWVGAALRDRGQDGRRHPRHSRRAAALVGDAAPAGGHHPPCWCPTTRRSRPGAIPLTELPEAR